MSGKYRIGLWAVLSLLFLQAAFANAENVPTTSVVHSHLPSAGPVVVEAGLLTSLTGIPVRDIRLAVYTGKKLVQVPFQIDQKDEDGLYIVEDGSGKTKAGNDSLDENDEITFMAFDAGEEIRAGAYDSGGSIKAGIKIEDIDGKHAKWIYILNDANGDEPATEGYVVYDESTDSITTDIYGLDFSKDKPFLVTGLKWAGPVKGEWSENIVDTMKLKHQGKMFGVIDFERDHGDYTSELVAVKDGPIRVIRRTSNRVEILWGLKAPEVLIDYIAHKNGFDMDIVIDIPFRIGLFFDDVESIATIDWREVVVEKGFFLRHRSAKEEFRIDGQMTDAEYQLNEYSDTNIEIIGDYGSIEMDMKISDDSPILKTTFYMDDVEALDGPENVPGQRGNVGFRTYKWEELTTAISHMVFNAHILKNEQRHLVKK